MTCPNDLILLMVNTTNTQIQKHGIRTFFASIAGIIAVYLIMASITSVWLNRTLTDTPTYVNTVAPLVTNPAIQNFISQKVASQLVNSVPSQDLAIAILPASDLNSSQTPAQLKALLTSTVQSNVLQIVKSPSFATLWRNTNETAHTLLLSQLNSNSNQLTLDLTPTIQGVISELKTTQLSSVADKITLGPNSGRVNIKNSGITQVHKYYKSFQDGTILVVSITIIALILSVWLSVHHSRTLRRILFGVGILALLQALVLSIPRFITLPGIDQASQAAAKAFIEAIVQNLFLASLIIGIVCMVTAIGSKLYTNFHH